MLVVAQTPDVVCITETWLTNDYPDSFLDLNDFIIFRKDRLNGLDNHGGVIIAVKSRLNPSSISIETVNELCFINCYIGRRTLKTRCSISTSILTSNYGPGAS